VPFDDFARLILAQAFTNNIVLIQLLGVSAFFAFSRDLRQALEVAVFSALLLLVTTAIGMPLLRWGLHPLGLRSLDLVLLAGLGAGLTRFFVVWVESHLPLSRRRHGVGLYLAGSNGAIIGFALQSSRAESPYVLTLIAALGTSLGLALFLIAFTALRQRLDKIDAPTAFRGAPLLLISAGLVAMSLMALRLPA